MVGRLAPCGASQSQLAQQLGWTLSLKRSLQLGPTLGLKRGWKDGLKLGLQLRFHALGLKRG